MGTRARRKGALAAVATLLCFASSPGFAAEAADAAKAKARSALSRARDAYRAERFAEAARGYLEAHDILDRAGLGAPAGLLYNAGLAHERLGECDRVADLFHRFLRAAPSKSTPDLRRRLEEAERCAPKVAINSTPAGATVQFDGVDRGQTPLTLYSRPGSYTLTLSKPGFRAVRRAVTHQAGQPLALNVDLVPEAGRAQLALDVRFAAEILLDGERIARGPYRGVRSLAPGQHELRLERAGCQPQTLTVDVPEGDAPFDLRPEAVCVPLATAPPPPPPSSTPNLVAPAPEPESGGPPASAWIAGGVGVAAGVAGAVFSALHVDAANRRDRLDADPTVTQSAPIREADDEAFRWSVASGASYGLAAVGIGTALVLWLTDGPDAALVASSPDGRGAVVRF